jgi:hypothetical protein
MGITLRGIATKRQFSRWNKRAKEWSLQVSSQYASVYSTAGFEPTLGVYSTSCFQHHTHQLGGRFLYMFRPIHEL